MVSPHQSTLDCRQVLDVVPEPLLILDENMAIVLANRSFGTTFGLSSESLKGMGMAQFHDCVLASPDLGRLLADIKGGRRDTGELQLEEDLPATGRRIFVVTAQRLPGTVSPGDLTLVSFQDVTVLVDSMRRAEIALAEVEKANGVLAEFASFAAHDLKAPLSRICKFTELLAGDIHHGSTERAAHHVHSIIGQTERMSRLIDDLLELAKVERLSDELQDVPLSSVVADVLQCLDDVITSTGAHFQFGDLPSVKGRRSQLVQVFVNLIDNAIRYRKRDEKPLIHLSARQSKDSVEVLVSDNGVGFDQTMAEEIFKPFRRLEANSEPGSGLGLSICRRIMDTVGGAIQAESRPNVGTTFTLKFPATQATEEERTPVS